MYRLPERNVVPDSVVLISFWNRQTPASVSARTDAATVHAMPINSHAHNLLIAGPE
jgi:hypothetical protein